MKQFLFLIVGVSLSFSISWAKGDPKKGASKVAACIACHGPKGVSLQDMWPNLAGQKAGYLAKAIRDYKSGARKDPLMSSQAAAIKDADIDDIAAYFASLK